jgi:hypothetical protein
MTERKRRPRQGGAPEITNNTIKTIPGSGTAAQDPQMPEHVLASLTTGSSSALVIASRLIGPLAIECEPLAVFRPLGRPDAVLIDAAAAALACGSVIAIVFADDADAERFEAEGGIECIYHRVDAYVLGQGYRQ